MDFEAKQAEIAKEMKRQVGFLIDSHAEKIVREADKFTAAEEKFSVGLTVELESLPKQATVEAKITIPGMKTKATAPFKRIDYDQMDLPIKDKKKK